MMKTMRMLRACKSLIIFGLTLKKTQTLNLLNLKLKATQLRSSRVVLSRITENCH